MYGIHASSDVPCNFNFYTMRTIVYAGSRVCSSEKFIIQDVRMLAYDLELGISPLGHAADARGSQYEARTNGLAALSPGS